MNKFKFLMFISMIISFSSYSQLPVDFHYDEAGNRVLRDSNMSQVQTDDVTTSKLVEESLESDQDSLDLTFSAIDLSMKLFPNPVQDQITVQIEGESDNDQIRVEIWNTSGQLISSEQISTATQNLNVSDLAAGLYILKAIIKDESLEWSFVKQK